MTATTRTTIGARYPTGATSRVFTDRPIMIRSTTIRFIPAMVLSTVIRLARATDIAIVSAFQSEDLITTIRTPTAIIITIRMGMGILMVTEAITALRTTTTVAVITTM